MDNSKSDIGLVFNKKLFETGTSNLLFVKKIKIFTPKKDYYEEIHINILNPRLKKFTKKKFLLKN